MKIKKIIFLLFIVILSVLFINSCEKEEDAVNNTENLSNDYVMTNVFSSSNVTLPDRYWFLDGDYYDRIFTIGDRIYFTADKIANYDTMVSNLILHSFDADGGNEETIQITPLNKTANANIILMWYDSEFNQIILEESDYIYYINKISVTDEVIFSIPISDIFNDVYTTVKTMAVGENDNIYLGTEKYVAVLSKEGKKICEITLDYTLQYIISAHDKKPILKMYDTNNNYSVRYSYINADTKSLEDIELKIRSDLFYTYSNIVYGEGYDYYHYTYDGVFGYDIETDETVMVLDWINSDISFSDIKLFTALSSDVMAMITYDSIIYKSSFSVLNHIPDDEVPEKEWIVLGHISSYQNDYINNMAASFNKNNTVYRIIVKNYYDSDYDTSLTKLNNDITAGNEPDLLYINYSIPFLSYANKGMFIDLYDYLQNDDALCDNLLSFVLEPSEINGKLYQLTTSFNVYSLMGKTSNLNGMTSWSVSEMLEYYKSLPEDTILMDNFSREYYQYNLVNCILSECLDYT